MHNTRFASFSRGLIGRPSRRDVVRGLTGCGLAWGAAQWPGIVAARKKHKHKKKHCKQRTVPQANAFGCLDVGQPCNGDSSACCSGICEGTKPKKCKPDTSRCVGHDESSCVAGDQAGVCVDGVMTVFCTTSFGWDGICDTTTGNAGYCYKNSACFPCRTDADCQPICGAQAACLQCPICELHEGTACATPDEFPCQTM
jgi:hypothetical protein